MKPRISRLTLELYHRGLATYKERKMVEKALLSDISVRERYEAFKEADREINQLVEKEISRLNIQETSIVFVPRKKKIVVGFILAAAILLCVLVPVFFYLRSNSPNKGNAIAESSTVSPTEETGNETDNIEETKIDENTPVQDKTPTPKQPAVKESPNKTVIAETPNPKPAKPSTDNEFKPNSGGTEIASVPEPDTGVRMRGGENSQPVTMPEEPPNINIPPGLSLILENMFANKGLTFVIIPSRITSIGKNAFAGNPLVSVTIGANVSMEDSSIPGNFAKAYNSYGRAKGIYTRADVNSEEWKKQ